jgi:hypothetical protein
MRSNSLQDFSLLHEASPLSISSLLCGFQILNSMRLHLIQRLSDIDTRSDGPNLIFCALSSYFLDMKLDGPDLISPADLTTTVLPPELENFLPPLGRFFEVSKASTFASSVSSIPLDITYVLGMLSLLSFVDYETSKVFSIFFSLYCYSVC